MQRSVHNPLLLIVNCLVEYRAGKVDTKLAMAAAAPRPEKQTVVDLARYLEKGVQVKMSGGRQGNDCENLRGKCVKLASMCRIIFFLVHS